MTTHQVHHTCNIELKGNNQHHGSQMRTQGVHLKRQLKEQKLNQNIKQYNTTPGRKQNCREINAINQDKTHTRSLSTSSESYNFSDPIKMVRNCKK